MLATPPPPSAPSARYRLVSLRGQGASGSVYEARDVMLGRTVAVKHMKLPVGADLAGSANQFVREAQTLARMKHPHVVEIYDVGLLADGRPYFVMELFEQSLGQLLEAQRPLSPEDVIALLLPLCGALACAHDLGIVHCDLKPDNVAVQRTAGGRLRGKLLDFGISKAASELVASTLVTGTPGYMAPEQVRGEQCGPSVDIWALGAVAFECLSGRLPFDADTVDEVVRQTAHEVPPSLASVAPALPPALAHAIDRALARSATARYRDMREFARALIGAAVLAGVPFAPDPDPIGLPDVARWRAESIATTARIPAVPKAVPASVVPVATELPVSGAPAGSGQLAGTQPARRRWTGLLLGVLVMGLSTAAFSAYRYGTGAPIAAHRAPVPRLPRVELEPPAFAPLRPEPAALESTASAPALGSTASPELERTASAPVLPSAMRATSASTDESDKADARLARASRRRSSSQGSSPRTRDQTEEVAAPVPAPVEVAPRAAPAAPQVGIKRDWEW